MNALLNYILCDPTTGTLRWAAPSSLPLKGTTIHWEEDERSGLASISPYGRLCGK